MTPTNEESSVQKGKKKQWRVKVPRLYKVAAEILTNHEDGKGSIRSLLYNAKHPNVRGIHALLCHTFQHDSDIRTFMRVSHLFKKHPTLSPNIARILLAEGLYGKKTLPGSSYPETAIREAIQFLHETKKVDISDQKNARPLTQVKWCRVNTLVTSMEDVVTLLKKEEWEESDLMTCTSYESFLERVKKLKPGSFIKDWHLPNVLALCLPTPMFDHSLVAERKLLFQDKASCLASEILSPKPGSNVIDACAAPGMKTLHLAALMQGKGKIYAVDRDGKRMETMKSIVSSSGAGHMVEFVNDDFIALDPGDRTVKYILVDPSCSGSGLRFREEQMKGETQFVDAVRLRKLCSFQEKLLLHALSFPKVKRVVYSTCSIHETENESVIERVLELSPDFIMEDIWRDTWERRGLEPLTQCIRTDPHSDLCNGFFVASLRRKRKSRACEESMKDEKL
ncbi:unnamed protein product [Darwinula stevensoni]|uniref:SAM-dependent MTase RsmB/NOP-type domain-containing protein n=1 Tax=Darwinula stevensoni TaxID=69355 RepID=A0A7R8XAR8_9CRUS|nr:unnamed protein product [Darwinula stevensoni]CAG0884053.1 unnamed protein product [Darwinula stevensoni]